MNEKAYAGQSLRFVRELLRCPAKWPTAIAAANDLPLNKDVIPPEFGAVCFYGSEPWGHTGIYVGNEVAVTIDLEGEPRLLNYLDEHYWGGYFLGWISAQHFAIHSSRQEANDD